MQGEEILQGKRILIVDDEPDILETLEELLDMCLIDSAPNFETAKKFLDKYTYDVAIFDIMGVKGYDLLKLATQKSIPALILTAHALSPDYLVKSVKGGAKSYIPKEKIADIPTFVRDILDARKRGIEKDSTWFARLRPFFDRKFGPEWRRKNEEFWKEFDEIYTNRLSKEELGEIM
ncbi:MAG: response regulator [Deltaproteobacteria bacterium]|nr:MAG: response regulator [Deltaproteobacteria bacterium]